MFNMSGTEIVVILLLALVVLGPEKLPDAIRKFGKTYAELKKMGTGFQQEFKSAMDEPMREMRETADLLKKSADFTTTTSTADMAADTATKPAIDTVTDRPTRNEGVAPADDEAVPTADVPFGDDAVAAAEVTVNDDAVTSVDERTDDPSGEPSEKPSEQPTDEPADRGGADGA